MLPSYVTSIKPHASPWHSSPGHERGLPTTGLQEDFFVVQYNKQVYTVSNKVAGELAEPTS